MFNWYTAPTFAVMLLFWLLACYLLTRSPRSLLSLAAVAALVTTAVYLLGQGMQANTTSVEQWRPWARDLLWGATLAPALWYWVTLLLLREDVLYFLTSLGGVCMAYAGIFVLLAGPDYSLQLLRLLVFTVILIVLAVALMDTGRHAFDRLFFDRDVRRLRANLAGAAQEAALTPNLDVVLGQTKREIGEVSAARLVRLTEEALRKLNRPAALQYQILREEYLLGTPNRRIMTQLAISESTFHRNRREGIAVLAREFGRGEDLLSHAKIDSF